MGRTPPFGTWLSQSTILKLRGLILLSAMLLLDTIAVTCLTEDVRLVTMYRTPTRVHSSNNLTTHPPATSVMFSSSRKPVPAYTCVLGTTTSLTDPRRESSGSPPSSRSKMCDVQFLGMSNVLGMPPFG